MSTRGMPTGGPKRLAKRGSAVSSVRPAGPATGSIAKPLRLPTPTPQPTNGDPVFDPKTFLANPGLGKKLLKLKKNEAAFVQGDASDAIF